MTILNLFNRGVLSKRSYNVCKSYGLTDFYKIEEYYRKHGTFLNLRNSGEKTDLELTRLCQSKNNDFDKKKEESKNYRSNELLTYLLLSKYSLEPRLLKKYEKVLPYLSQIIVMPMEHRLEQVLKIKGISNSSAIGICDHIEYHVNFYYDNREPVRWFLSLDRNIFNELSKAFKKDIYLEYMKWVMLNNKENFSIVLFLEDEIIKLHSKVKIECFKKIFNLKFIAKKDRHGLKKKIFEEFGKRLSLSNERLRQLSVKFKEQCLIIGDFLSKWLCVYDEPNLKMLNNTIEGLGAPHQFCLHGKSLELFRLIGPYLNSLIIGKIFTHVNVLYKDMPTGSPLFYCFTSRVIQSSKLLKILERIEFIFYCDRTKTEEVSIVGLLALEGVKYEEFYEYEMALEYIIFDRYGAIINTDKNILLIPNKKLSSHEMVVDILKDNDKPMHLSLISSAIHDKYDVELSEERVRSIVGRGRSSRFILTGTSEYGLEEWKDHGYEDGTIIDLIERFLANSRHPQHISLIAREVCKLRDTTQRSIEGLINSDELQRFDKLPEGFYGVHSANNQVFKNELSYLPGRLMPQVVKIIRKNGKKFIPLHQLVEILSSKYDTHYLHALARVEMLIEQKQLFLNDEKFVFINED